MARRTRSKGSSSAIRTVIRRLLVTGVTVADAWIGGHLRLGRVGRSRPAAEDGSDPFQAVAMGDTGRTAAPPPVLRETRDFSSMSTPVIGRSVFRTIPYPGESRRAK